MTVVLSGGNEFEQQSNGLNRGMLRLVSKTPARIMVIPVAATDNPRKAVRTGVGYLSRLGARAEELMITDQSTANDQALAAAVEAADIMYFTDGNPLSMVEILSNSAALPKLWSAWKNRAILAASGASAMALCDYYWDSGLWEKGLGLFKGIVVLPHYEYVAGRFSPERLRKDLPAGYTILGLDEATGIIIDGQRVKVHGQGIVTVYGPDSEKEYTDTDTFSLDSRIDPDESEYSG
jgi:cyanophycinase-like exopeptidase